jgi:hypothetical protein
LAELCAYQNLCFLEGTTDLWLSRRSHHCNEMVELCTTQEANAQGEERN